MKWRSLWSSSFPRASSTIFPSHSKQPRKKPWVTSWSLWLPCAWYSTSISSCRTYIGRSFSPNWYLYVWSSERKWGLKLRLKMYNRKKKSRSKRSVRNNQWIKLKTTPEMWYQIKIKVRYKLKLKLNLCSSISLTNMCMGKGLLSLSWKHIILTLKILLEELITYCFEVLLCIVKHKHQFRIETRCILRTWRLNMCTKKKMHCLACLAEPISTKSLLLIQGNM